MSAIPAWRPSSTSGPGKPRPTVVYHGPRGETTLYGGKITENVVQAICRDLLADALVRLEAADLPGIQRGVELAESYANMDVFAFPSRTDTFGNVVLEAQAAGIPCVVSNRGGPCELVENGSDGFVTQALDVGDFARALRVLAKDAELRKMMGQEARKRVRDRNWDNAFRQFWNETL